MDELIWSSPDLFLSLRWQPLFWRQAAYTLIWINFPMIKYRSESMVGARVKIFKQIRFVSAVETQVDRMFAFMMEIEVDSGWRWDGSKSEGGLEAWLYVHLDMLMKLSWFIIFKLIWNYR